MSVRVNIGSFGSKFSTSSLVCTLLAGVLVASTSKQCPAAQESSDGVLFREVQNQFDTMRSTAYQHQIKVDRNAGSFRYDCVGLVSYALKQAAPTAKESAFQYLGIKPGYIPTPGKYVTFFLSLGDKSQPGWEPVKKVCDLRAGDVVAWEQKTATSNGHAVILAGTPYEGPSGDWIVTIYDSTAAPHLEDSRVSDTRAEPLAGSTKRSGLGRGIMAFTADSGTGVLTGYRWAPKAKAFVVPIAAGRPTS